MLDTVLRWLGAAALMLALSVVGTDTRADAYSPVVAEVAT